MADNLGRGSLERIISFENLLLASRRARKGRRFRAHPIYYTLLMNAFPLLYRLGMPPRMLDRAYGNPR